MGDEAEPKVEALSHILALSLSIFLVIVGVEHFRDPVWFEPLVPEILGNSRFWVLASGVFEIALGLALLPPKWRTWSGPSTAAFLVLLYWANLNMWVNDIPLNGRVFEDKWHVLRGLGQLAMILVCLWLSGWKKQEYHRDWSVADYKQLLKGGSFPSGFMWGVATSSHQIEGGNRNNWTEFEPRSTSGQSSGSACDHWNRVDEDVDLIAALNVGHYRLSVEWSRLAPEQGVWDDEAMQWYSDLVDKLLAKGVEPMVTLHHFTQPIWWDEKGGFEREENLDDWIDFCRKVFEHLSDRVTWWCTINEPAVVVSMGYVLCEFPPAEQDWSRARAAALNMMRAHARCYHLLKSMNNGDRCQIGLVKNFNVFDPIDGWNPVHRVVTRTLDEMFNLSWLHGLKTGRFRPVNGIVRKLVPGLKGSVDFFGLNYYSHYLTKFVRPTKVELVPPIRPWQERTDFRYPMYAEGLRRAIESVSEYTDAPIIITENGVADDDDDMRPEHLKRHLLVISEAISDGFDVRGYYHWSLMDNFEWAEGYDLRFGLYEVDFDTHVRNLRKSGRLYAEIVSANSS